MYTSVLGATKSCLSKAQMAEAQRLCNCREYGTPSGPIHGLSATDAYQAIDVSRGAQGPGCETAPRVALPSDFDVSDPCGELRRGLCSSRLLRRPDQQTSVPAAETEAEDYEEEKTRGVLRAQSLAVFGLLALVLVGAGTVVYRELRS